MARFFVGQRVRKVRGENGIGCTGVIRSIGPGPLDTDMTVSYDTESDAASGEILPAWTVFYSYQELFEPILPANKPVSIAKIVAEFPGLARALGVVA